VYYREPADLNPSDFEAITGGERSLDTVITHAERVLYDDPHYNVALQELDEAFIGTDSHDIHQVVGIFLGYGLSDCLRRDRV
jgi:hypothetical protein